MAERAFVMEDGPEISSRWLPQPGGAETGGEVAGQAGVRIAVGTTLADAEKALILATLEHFQNHRERTAVALGISSKTLYNRLKEYGLEK